MRQRRSPRARFRAVLEQKRGLPSLQVFIDRSRDHLVAVLRRLHPRIKIPEEPERVWQKAIDKLGLYEAKHAAAFFVAEQAVAQAERKALEARLRRLSEAVEVHPGSHRVELVNRSTADYRTQTSPATYARGFVELEELQHRAAAPAVDFEIVHDRSPAPPPTPFNRSPRGLERWTLVGYVATELDAEVLRRKPGLTLREMVKACWGNGTNPRVFFPFLPHGFEERAGLDFFGGEKKK